MYQYTGRKIDCVLFPNPNNGSFTLDYTGTKADVLDIEVVDVAGRVAAHQRWAVAAGTSQRTLDFRSLSRGTYVVSVRGAEGAVGIKTIVR